MPVPDLPELGDKWQKGTLSVSHRLTVGHTDEWVRVVVGSSVGSRPLASPCGKSPTCGISVRFNHVGKAFIRCLKQKSCFPDVPRPTHVQPCRTHTAQRPEPLPIDAVGRATPDVSRVPPSKPHVVGS